MANFSIIPDKAYIEEFNTKGNVLTMKLTHCPFRVGERIDVENERVRVTGVILSKVGTWVKVRIEQIAEKGEKPLIMEI